MMGLVRVAFWQDRRSFREDVKTLDCESGPIASPAHL